MVELLASLVILALLALAIAPSFIAQLDRDARKTESEALTRISKGFADSVMTTRTIPDAETYVAAVARQLGCHADDIRKNRRGSPRLLLVDPAITDTIPIPYTQSHLGVTIPIPRRLGIIFISSISAPLPAGLREGVASSTEAFDSIWNCPDGEVPRGWSWAGRPHDLLIERLNLSTLFVPLVLNYDRNTVGSANQGRFHIDASTTNTLPTLPSYAANYLKGSLLGLHFHNATRDSVQAREILQHPTSFTYQQDSWRGPLFVGSNVRDASGTDLQEAHDEFVLAPSSASLSAESSTTDALPPASASESSASAADSTATSGNVVGAISRFMDSFLDWRDRGYSQEDPLHAEVIQLANLVLTSTASLVMLGPTDGNGEGGTIGHGHLRGNNGHGNNLDGVDGSNPGLGGGGPTGKLNDGNDPSGDLDDESIDRPHGN